MSGLENAEKLLRLSTWQIFAVYLRLDRERLECDAETLFCAYEHLMGMSLPQKFVTAKSFEGDLKREYRNRFLVLQDD